MNSTGEFNEHQLKKRFEEEGMKLIQTGEWKSYIVMLHMLCQYGIKF